MTISFLTCEILYLGRWKQFQRKNFIHYKSLFSSPVKEIGLGILMRWCLIEAYSISLVCEPVKLQKKTWRNFFSSIGPLNIWYKRCLENHNSLPNLSLYIKKAYWSSWPKKTRKKNTPYLNRQVEFTKALLWGWENVNPKSHVKLFSFCHKERKNGIG